MGKPRSRTPISNLLRKNDALKTALIQASVNLSILAAGVVLYLNYILLKPYFGPLFWAVLVSIPLHPIKKNLVQIISSGLSSNKESSFFSVVTTIFKAFLLFLFGDSWVSLVPICDFDPAKEIQTTINKQLLSSHSGPYFVYLIRGSFLYTIFLIVSGLRWNHWIIVFTITAFLFGVRVISLGVQTLYHHILDPYFVRFVVYICRRIDSGVFHFPSKILSRINNVYVEMKRDPAQETAGRANSMSVILLLVSVLLCSTILSGFLILQFLREANLFVDKTMLFVNDTVIHGKLVHDSQLHEQLGSVMDNMGTRILEWSDTQLQERFPGYNLTTMDLYHKAAQLYHAEFDPPSGTVASNQNNTQDIHSTSYENFPKTLFLFKQILRGNFSALLSSETLHEFVTEIKHASIQGPKILFHYDKDYIDEILFQNQDYLANIGQVILENTGLLFNYLASIFLYLVHFLSYGLHLLAQITLFLITLYYLLLCKQNVLDLLGDLTYHMDKNHLFRSSLQKSINAVFLTTLRMFVFHGLFTWLTLSLCNVQLVYITTFMSGMTAILPILSPFWIVLPACLELYLRKQSIAAVFLFSSHLLASWIVDSAIYSDIPDSNSYFTGMSIVLGLWAFGWQGVVFGPLLGCLPVTAFHLYSKLLLGEKKGVSEQEPDSDESSSNYSIN